MKKYVEYKDSGVPWIGEIPLEWRVGRPKYNYYLKGRIGWQGLKSDEFVDNTPYYLVTGTDFRNGRVDWGKCYHITKERFAEAPEIHVKSGDLLVTKDGTIGKVAYIEDKPDYVSLNSHLLLMRPLNNLLDNRFLFWVIQCQIFENYYGVTQSGSIMASLSQEKISNFSFPLPSREEQTVIADYLDNRVKTIDSIIDEAKVSIEEYKAWKASIIYEAVTKGLDKNVEMKDSGVDWIGEIPCNWQVVSFLTYIKSIVDYRGKTPDKQIEGTQLITAKNIKDGKIDYEISKEYVRTEEYEEIMHRGRVEIGDVLFTTEAPLGAVANADQTGFALAQRIIKFRGVEEKIDNYYLKYWIMSSGFQQNLYTFSTGSTAKGIKASKLGLLKQVLPPLEDQKKIVDYLDKICLSFEDIIKEKESLISDLESYKKSLIFEVVTGKRKVV